MLPARRLRLLPLLLPLSRPIMPRVDSPMPRETLRRFRRRGDAAAPAPAPVPAPEAGRTASCAFRRAFSACRASTWLTAASYIAVMRSSLASTDSPSSDGAAAGAPFCAGAGVRALAERARAIEPANALPW